MDAKKFGAYIAKIRKEKNMTQADLAIKLQVTDKAVSRWERGIGFPDINTLEPLADALGISVLELMKSEKNYEDNVSKTVAADVLTDTLSIANTQRRQERKHVVTVVSAAFVLVLIILFADNVQGRWDYVLFISLGVVLPLLCLCAFLGLIGYGLWRKVHHMSCKQTVIASLIFASILILFFGVFVLLGAIGMFPVPN